MADLLLEIGTEDLPPGAIGPAAQQLAEAVRRALDDLRLTAGNVTSCGTPRRLAVLASGVADRQRPVERRVRGPAAAAAYDGQGHPTQAAVGFARSQRVPVERLRIVEEADGRRYVAAVIRERGRPAAAVLPAALEAAVASLSFPKTMRWGGGDLRFARPIRWLVALLGARILPVTLAGLRAGRSTYGHRVLDPRGRALRHPSEYAPVLRRAKVIVDPKRRRTMIVDQATALARTAGGRPVLDPHLVDELVMSTEHPHALRGTFDPASLDLPREVLVTVMQHHQKYLAVEDARGRLLPGFIAVRDGGAAHLATVRQGHEWVLAARLADARFFFAEDRKKPLEGYIPALDGLVVHAQMGTMGERTRRLVGLARAASPLLGLDGRTAEALARAATLCKADLVTHMVGEFPELQGTVGGIYAALDGEATDVARAIGEHYRPTGAGDSAPKTHLGALLGLIDRCDTLVGAIAAGLQPTGSEDPYGLRRTAAGVVEIVLMLRLRLPMHRLLWEAFDRVKDDIKGRAPAFVVEPQEGPIPQPVLQATDFLQQRLRTALIERGIRYDLVDAALAVSGDDLLAGSLRAEILADAAGSREFPGVYVAYDRASRILTPEAVGQVDPVRFEAPVERQLYEALQAVRGAVAEAAEAGDFRRALEHLLRLVDPVNRIFDDVLIMAPDPAVRANRLAVLRAVTEVFRLVADFSRIVMGEGEKPPGATRTAQNH